MKEKEVFHLHSLEIWDYGMYQDSWTESYMHICKYRKTGYKIEWFCKSNQKFSFFTQQYIIDILLCQNKIFKVLKSKTGFCFQVKVTLEKKGYVYSTQNYEK